MRLGDPSLVGQQYILPSPQFLAQGHYCKILSPAVGASYSSQFATVVGF